MIVIKGTVACVQMASRNFDWRCVEANELVAMILFPSASAVATPFLHECSSLSIISTLRGISLRHNLPVRIH